MDLANGVGKQDWGSFPFSFCVAASALALLIADPTSPLTHRWSPHVSPKISGLSEPKRETLKKPGFPSVLGGVELGWGAMINHS